MTPESLLLTSSRQAARCVTTGGKEHDRDTYSFRAGKNRIMQRICVQHKCGKHESLVWEERQHPAHNQATGAFLRDKFSLFIVAMTSSGRSAVLLRQQERL